MFNLLHLLLVVATQITRSWCLHDTTQTVHIKQHQTNGELCQTQRLWKSLKRQCQFDCPSCCKQMQCHEM